MPFFHFRQTYKDLQRIRHILNTLVKYGFGYIVERLNLQSYIPLGKRIFRLGKKEEHIPVSPAERFRLVLEELGPTFIKFGQLLSARRDILPEEFIKELEKLLDEVPPFPFEEVEKEIYNQFNKPLEELFFSFDKKPLAAASIGQVHRARLFSGKDVVVKIRRPGIDEIIERDLSILQTFARLLERYIPESRLYDPVGMVDEFTRSIRRELDFRIEGRSAERFREMFKNSQTVYVPEVIWELSGKNILTIEYAEGKRISDIDGDPQFRHTIAKNFVESYLVQIFEYGFFHADPHPGNIFILEDGKICFHDFGIMGHLDEDMMDSLSNLLLAILEKDTERIMDIYLDVGILSGEFDPRAFKKDLRDFLEEYYDLPLKEFSFAEFVTGLITLGRRYYIKLPTDLLLFGKTFMTVESVVRNLDPDFNLIENIRPYTYILMRRRFLKPSNIYKDVLKMGMELNSFLRKLPHNMHSVIRRLQEGKIEVEIKHEKLEDLELHIDKASNRLSFSLIVAAVIVGSSIIMQTEIGPSLLGFPLIGIIGYVMAGFLGLWLVLAILKSGRL